MGGRVWSVGDYSIVIMDYSFDVLPEDGVNKSEIEEVKKIPLNIKIEKRFTNEEKEMNIPVGDLFPFKKYDDEKYGIDWHGETDPRYWLLDLLKKQNKEIKIKPQLNVNCHEIEPPNYYLQSDIFDDDIKIGITERIFVIANVKELDWLGSRGFFNGR